MTNLIFNNNSIRTNGNLVCLTDMAKPFSKLVTGWTRLDSTQAYLEALSADMQISITLLIETSDAGTFAHPEVAIAFAQWLSPEFHVWCIRHLRTLMETGSTQLKPVEQPKLMPYDYIAAMPNLIAFGIADDPIIKSLMTQRVAEQLGSSKQLNSDESEDLVICSSVASDLGFQLKNGQDKALGKYVKKFVEPEGRTQHGQYKVWVYRRKSIVQHVKDFFLQSEQAA